MAERWLRSLRYRRPRARELATRCLDTLLLPFSRHELVRGADGSRHAVAFSFDDGPSPHNSPPILDLLEQYNARATFFVVGERIAGREEIVRRMIHSGHEVGNHTYTHRHTVYLSSGELEAELAETRGLAASLGADTRFVRPPFGKDRRRIAIAAEALGMTVALWSVDSGDASGYSAREITDTVLTRTQPGSIVLLHDGGELRPATLDACARIIPALQADGLELVTLSELLDSQARGESITQGLAPQHDDLARH